MIFKTASEFFNIALNVARHRSKLDSEDGDASDSARDVSSRLGFHIAFYYWNNWFADRPAGERLFDRFLSISSSRARAETLSHIGNAFEKAVATPEVQPLIERARSMLDR